MIHRTIQKLTTCSLVLFYSWSMAEVFITNNVTGDGADRTGDRLVVYIKAQWLAAKYNLPFYRADFPTADCFTFYTTDDALKEKKKIEKYTYTRCSKEVAIERIYKKRKSKAMIGIDFCCDIDPINDKQEWHSFKKEMQEHIKPNFAIPSLPKRSGAISIAIHMRLGSGKDTGLLSPQEYTDGHYAYYFDEAPLIIHEPNATLVQTPLRTSPYMDIIFPLRFVPVQFYIDQVRMFIDFFADKEIDLFLFTDHQEPEALARQFQASLDTDRVHIHYLIDHGFDPKQVVRDLFLMTQCDCLIRGRSHFAHVAEFLGNHQIVLFPKRHVWQENCLYIPDVAVVAPNKAIADALRGYVDRRLAKVSVSEE